ncbi:hypothetical protein HO133_000565 [Letharia lupina]|uniref:Uncharacterized protein n=1 Tax=Letharia lupina TaxID=560253 RepID=A0A8H6CHU1_9LECA|nr:uncharacterized protein HO133_000565 [Letharia lupina]KAF6223722.1 hypothetical protein HO133_000565 [Letharia lupina]
MTRVHFVHSYGHCCIKCWITARDVQVFYWPVDADTRSLTNTSAPTTTVNPQSLVSNGVTLLVHAQASSLSPDTDATCSISPSVYVAYRNLRASDVCPSFGDGDFTRGNVYNTTIAYQPGLLSTSICTGEPEGFYQGFSAINVTELQHPTIYNGTCMGLDASLESTTNGPYLSLPQDLTILDPAWSTCNAVLWGAFDPPIALHTATALVPDPGKGSQPTPAPGSPVAPPHAPPTPTANPIGHGNPATHSPAPKADPQGPGQQNAHPPDAVKPSANDPKADPQDPGEQQPNPPDPIQPPVNSKNDDPATSTAIPIALNGDNAAQGSPKVVSDPKSNEPQPTGEISEGDPGADPGSGHNAGPALDPAEDLDQSTADYAQPLPSIGGYQIQAASGGGVIIASTTIRPGVQTTIDSTPLSVEKGQIVIASSTIPLALPSADPIITLANGDIISAGGKAATVSGTTVALAPDGNALVINGKTSPVPPPPVPILTVAGQTLTAAATGFAIGGQSVLPGGSAVTYAGSVFSLASGRNALVVNGRTTPLPSPPVSVFQIGSETFTAIPTGFAVGAQSVSPGGSAVLVNGTLISLGSSELVIGTSTMPLGSAAQTRAGALGSLIMYGFGGGTSPTGGSSNGSNVVPFVGEGGKLRVGFGTVVLALIVSLGAGTVA